MWFVLWTSEQKSAYFFNYCDSSGDKSTFITPALLLYSR